MALLTVETLIQDAIQDGLGLPSENIDNELISLGVRYFNKGGKMLTDSYIWDERKLDVYEATPTDGIITLGSTTDIVMAIRPKDTSTTDMLNYALWPQDIVDAFIRGQEITSNRFQYLAPDSSDNKRIRVSEDDSVDTYYVYALKKFVRAEVNASYSAGDPSATPEDYRVLTWKIDHLTEVLVDYMADRFREWDGQSKTGDWMSSLEAEVNKIISQQSTSRVITPSYSMFAGLGFKLGEVVSTLRTV